MTYLEAEKNLVLYLAEALNLVPDMDIFAGTPPDGIVEALTAELAEGQPAGLNRINSFIVRIGGKFFSRKTCRQHAFSITSLLPVFGANGLASVKLADDVPLKFSQEEKNSGKLHCFTLALVVSFA